MAESTEASGITPNIDRQVGIGEKSGLPTVDSVSDGGNDSDPVTDDTQWNDIPEGSKFEHLDHPADVQLHSWGDTLQESFEHIAISMFAYMTEISKVEKVSKYTIEAEGDDMLSLLYHYLDELLFAFSTDPFFIPREMSIDVLDLENFKIKATGHGETFDLTKHPQTDFTLRNNVGNGSQGNNLLQYASSQ